jgi:hypothetical protein
VPWADARGVAVCSGMVAENKKRRTKARKEYIDTVVNLVYFIKKRDPRVKAMAKEAAAMKEEQDRAAAVQKEAALAERKRREVGARLSPCQACASVLCACATSLARGGLLPSNIVRPSIQQTPLPQLAQRRPRAHYRRRRRHAFLCVWLGRAWHLSRRAAGGAT